MFRIRMSFSSRLMVPPVTVPPSSGFSLKIVAVPSTSRTPSIVMLFVAAIKIMGAVVSDRSISESRSVMVEFSMERILMAICVASVVIFATMVHPSKSRSPLASEAFSASSLMTIVENPLEAGFSFMLVPIRTQSVKLASVTME